MIRLLTFALVLVLQCGWVFPASANDKLFEVRGEGRLITRAEAEEILKRYHSIPGGFLLEGKAVGLNAIKSVKFNAARNELLLDNALTHTSSLPIQDLVALCRAIAQDERIGVSITEEIDIVYGKLPSESEVAGALKLADYFLGDIIFPPLVWADGYKFPNDFQPQGTSADQHAAVFFRFTDFQFAVTNGKLQLQRAKFDVRIVPLLSKQAADGGYLPDFKAIAVGKGFEAQEINARHIGDNVSYYLRESIVERALVYGEAAAVLRSLKEAGVDMTGLAESIEAAAGRSARARTAKMTLEERWAKYLKEIQAAKRFQNWSAPPYDRYLRTAHAPGQR
jgi:hypothetical protein